MPQPQVLVPPAQYWQAMGLRYWQVFDLQYWQALWLAVRFTALRRPNTYCRSQAGTYRAIGANTATPTLCDKSAGTATQPYVTRAPALWTRVPSVP